MKRARVRQTPLQPQRSPSPTLPLHLYTSLASSSCSSSSAAIDAREATLLDPRDCNDTLDTLERVTWSGWIHDDSHEQQRREVITDRYDILHLVPSIPSLLPAPPTDVTEAGWGFGFEDLPSDHEELFFLNSSADRADLERRKKRRKLQDERDHRVRERLLQQQEGAGGAGDGGSHNDDEDDDKQQPPAEINQLMSRLHTTLSRSANPALLELRILANHGSDPRFASFLKREGRWYQWWVDLREGNEVEVGARGAAKEEEEEEEKPATSATGGLGGLAAYGSDSDDDGASSSNEEDDEDEDGLDAQDRSEAQVEDDAEQRASSSSKSPRPESASVAVPDSVSTITLTSSSSTTTTSSGTITLAPPPRTGLGTSGNGKPVDLTVAQGVKAVVEGEYQSGDYAKRQEEEEEKEKKEARAAKAREWARRRREARGGKDAVEIA